jgi:protein-L-isoaspartate(D-aspartate) O-methyltransferase
MDWNASHAMPFQSRLGIGRQMAASMHAVRRLLLLTVVALIMPVATCLAAGNDTSAQRRAMVETIQSIQAHRPIEAGGSIDQAVLQALRTVPRHEFVPEKLKEQAYANKPLPIGYGQTISQPYIVALMTDLLELRPDDVVFELGTGSGYQAAVLSCLASEVHTMEIVPELAETARQRLKRLGFNNVSVLHGDAYFGLKSQAPFDAIVVTAAAGHIPPPLVRQLKAGGRMVIPVGHPFMTQQLTLVSKDSQGSVSTRHLLPVSFVPLTGQH